MAAGTAHTGTEGMAGRRIDELVSRAATPVEARVAGAVRQGSHRLPWGAHLLPHRRWPHRSC